MKTTPKLNYALLAIIGVCGLLASLVVIASIILGTGAYGVRQPSMMPAYNVGDHVLADKLFFHANGLRRGDVVIVHFPDTGPVENLKRIIGLPGEQVQIHDGKVFVNGQPLDEPYLAPTTKTSPTTEDTWQLGTQEYFALGDNRDASADSRMHGPVSASDIVGRVFFRYTTGPTPTPAP